MDRLFICLANSYKRGGRCIAGIEIRFNASGHWGIVRDSRGNPTWIRPVTKTPNGEIPAEEALPFELLSIVRVVKAEPCPHGAHSENVYYTRLEQTHLRVQLTDIVAEHLFDLYHQDIFCNQGKAIPPNVYAKGRYSLMFLKPDNPFVYVDTSREKLQFRMDFSYRGVRYDFPITDPDFLDFLRDDPEQIGDFPEIHITVSLGLEHEGWHHKLVAGVIGYKRHEVIPTNIGDEVKIPFLKEPEEPSYMERQKQLHANAYAKWTKEDDVLLMELFSQGATVSALMERFGRNRGSIRSRLKKLTENKLHATQQKEHNYTSYDYTGDDSTLLLSESDAVYEVEDKTKKKGWRALFSFLQRD